MQTFLSNQDWQYPFSSEPNKWHVGFWKITSILIFMHFEKSGPIARQWITLSLVLINTLSLLDPIFCNQSISNNCSYKPSFPPKLQRVCVMKVKAKSIWLVWPELFGLIQNIFTCIILIQIFTKSLIWKTHRTLKN